MTPLHERAADALDAMRHQLDPIDDWREPLERAAAELRRLAAVEAAYDGKAHELLVLEHSYDRLTDDRDQLIEQRDDLRAERDRLAAEVSRLRADAERLDWAEVHAFAIVDECRPQGTWRVSVAGDAAYGDTIRAAIDAAMTGERAA